MRRVHETFFHIGLFFLILTPFAFYMALFTLYPAVFFMLLSLPLGIAHMRQSFLTGAVDVLSHVRYFIVALVCAFVFTLVFQLLYVRVDSPLLYGTTWLAFLCALYLVPFAVIRWANGGRWLRLRTAWLLLAAAVLLPVGLWAAHPDALRGAVEAGNGLAVRLHLALGRDVNRRHQYGGTALSSAVMRGHLEVVRLLLERGADPNVVVPGAQTPLETAASGGNLQLVKLLHAAGARLDGSGALRAATAHGAHDVVDWLLARQADVAGGGVLEAITKITDTETVRLLLGESAARGDMERVQLLLEHGADPNQRGANGERPLLHVVQSPRITDPKHRLVLIRMLLDHGAVVAGSGALTAAVIRGDTEIVQLLLSHTPQPDRSDGLAQSADSGNLELMKLFLEHGADPNRPDKNGHSPLRRAVRSTMATADQKLVLINLLVEHGAEVSGSGALEEAVQYIGRGSARKIIPLLLSKTPRSEHSNGLVMSVDEGDPELVRLFLEHGADPNHRDKFGTPPLHIAVQRDIDNKNKLVIIDLLLEHGADITLKDKSGRTALALATTSVATHLRAKGAR